MYKIIVPTYLEMGVRNVKKYSITLNNYRNRHFQVNNRLKIKYKEMIKQLVASWGGSKLEPPISIDFKFYSGTKRKYDLSGMCAIHDKFFCDALVELGFIEDDDIENINEVLYKYGGYDKGNQRIEIIINKN